MLKTAFSLLFLFIIFIGRAQQGYFVLIQSENKQLFSAKLGSQTFASSDEGRLILPQLKDSTYAITIQFPDNRYPEQKFAITINKREQGLQLKNVESKGWILVNTQTGETKQAIKNDVATQ